MMPEIDSPQFIEAFQLRRDHCQTLLILSRQQQAMIADADYSELLNVLARKQQVLNGLEEVTRQHAVLWAQWKLQRDQLARTDRERCEQILGDTEKILADLVETEDAGTLELSRRRDETRTQLESVSTGSRAHQAYQDSDGSPGRQRLNVNM